jgi:hypothetical protein
MRENEDGPEFFIEQARWPGWFFMFVAALLLAGTFAAIKVHDRSAEYVRTHQGAR